MDESFQARLARIEAGQGQTVVFVGDEEHCFDKDGKRIAPASKTGGPSEAGPRGSVTGALLLGLIAVPAALALHGRLAPFEPSAQIDDGYLMTVGAGALMIAVVLGRLLRANSVRQTLASCLGVVAALATVHNLAHWQPERAEMAFGAGWVEMQLAQTDPRTATLRDVRFAF